MKKLNCVFLLLMIALTSNAQDAKKRGDKTTVSVSIGISADEVSAVNINSPVYSNQILNELNKSQDVAFVLVDANQNPEIMIELGVTNLNIGHRLQRSKNIPTTSRMVVGTDSRGRSITRTTNVIIEEVFVERNSSAGFSIQMKSSSDSSFIVQKKFNSLYNYSQATIVSPDQVGIRAQNSLAPKVSPEPKFEEFLFLLSKKDLTPYLASELRKIYNSKNPTARIN